MDDQNQNTQPLVSGTPPNVPAMPEDITPQTPPQTAIPPVETPEPETPFVPSQPGPMTTTTTVTSTEPVEVPPMTTPIDTPTEESPVPIPAPMTTETTTTTTTETPVPTEVQMPAAKKKVSPVILGALALLLVVGVAGAAYYVSNQLSTRQAVAPTAPESKPQAAALCRLLYETQCIQRSDCEWDYDHCISKIVTTPTPPPATNNSTGGGDNNTKTTTTSGESSSSLYVSKPTDGCGSTAYHKYDCGTQCCRTTSTYAKDANCCTTGCKEPDSSGILNGAEEKLWCESDTIDQFQEANQITFKRTGTAAIYLSGTFHYKVSLTKKSGDGAASFSIPSSGDYVVGGTSYTIGTVSAGSVYTMSITLKEDVDVSRGASLGWRKPKSVQTAHPSCDASGTVTKASALFDLKTETTDVDYPVMCWADSIITGGPDQSMAEKYDFDDFTVAVGYSSSTTVGMCSKINIYKYDTATSAYSSTALTATELQNLHIGDVLQFEMEASMENLSGKFRVTTNGSAGDWLTAREKTTSNWTKLVYYPYTISALGAYSFEGQVTTTAQ
ncbi:MAG TPA: hypothetical protein PLI45_02980 [Candidatus Woesebacteria bacterium]|nr:hypothetical protein [Candidatus Woesebacteria bacterium]